MAKRKSKKPQQEDTSILLDSSVPQSKKRIPLTSNASPALVFIILFTVGAFLMGWFFVQQQNSIDELSGSFTAMQRRIANLQQVITDAQTDTGMGLEERIFALEEAQKQAQERAEVALATSEKLKNSTLYTQLLNLHDEMDTRLNEMKQVSLSVTNLQAMFKNQFKEFEAMKESVAAGLHSSSAVAKNVAGLSNAVASAYSKAEEQVASVEALYTQLEGQASVLNELKESMHLHDVALHANNQEMAAIKEFVEAQQALRTQTLEEMLNSVLMTLDEQFFTSQILHSSVMAQLQTFHTQELKSNEESPAAEEFTSFAAANTTEVQEMLDDEQKTEQQDAEDEAKEDAEEDKAMQEELPVEQEVKVDVTEEQQEVTEEQEEEEITEEEITTEEEEDEEITGQSEEQEDEDVAEQSEEQDDEDVREQSEEQDDEDVREQSEEQEVAGETAKEQFAEETAYGHILDESSEEDVPEEAVESWETVEEESAEFNSEVSMDETEEDE